MASASILFDSRTQRLTLEDVCDHLTRSAVSCRLGEWVFLGQVCPQIEVHSTPPFALQLNDSSEIVAAETLEMIEDRISQFSPEQVAALEQCDSRIEVVSGAQPVITRFPEGGIVSYTPEPDLTSPEAQGLLRELARFLNGTLIQDELG